MPLRSRNQLLASDRAAEARVVAAQRDVAEERLDPGAPLQRDGPQYTAGLSNSSMRSSVSTPPPDACTAPRTMQLPPRSTLQWLDSVPGTAIAHDAAIVGAEPRCCRR